MRGREMLRPAAVCGGLLLLILLVTVPARLLAFVLPADRIHLSGYSGTLWNGAAAQAALSIGPDWISLGSIQWSLSPLSLLMLSPRIELHSEWGRQRLEMDMRVSPGGALRVYRLDSRFPASLVRQWLPVQLRGDISLSVQDLALAGKTLKSGSGKLTWQRAYWIGNNSGQNLGDYLLEFRVGESGRLTAEISTLGGPVQAAGTLSVQGRSYSVDVRLGSREGFGMEIGSALQLMAAPVDDGYHLKFESKF